MERWLQSRSVELAAKMKYHVEFLNLILLKWVTFSKTKQQKRYNAIFLNMIKKLWSIFSENLIPVTKCINYWFIRTIYTMFMCCFCRLFTFFHVNHTKDWDNTFAIILHTNNNKKSKHRRSWRRNSCPIFPESYLFLIGYTCCLPNLVFRVFRIRSQWPFSSLIWVSSIWCCFVCCVNKIIKNKKF